MKSFLIILLAVIVATVIALRIFESGFTRGVETASKPISAPAVPATSSAPITAPPSNIGVFHGPTDAPHIIGPRADPPNY